MTKSDDESFRALIEANVRGWKGYWAAPSIGSRSHST